MVDITNEPVYEGPSEDDLCQATEALEGALVRIMAHADWTLEEKTREMELYLAGIQKRARRMIGQKATHLENAYYDIAGAILGALQEGAGSLEMRLAQIRQAAALGGDSGAPTDQQGGELPSFGQSGAHQALLRQDGTTIPGEATARHLLQTPAPAPGMVAAPIPGLPVAPSVGPRAFIPSGISQPITGGGGGAEFDGTTTPTRPIMPGTIRPNGRRPSAGRVDTGLDIPDGGGEDETAPPEEEKAAPQALTSADIEALCRCLSRLAPTAGIENARPPRMQPIEIPDQGIDEEWEWWGFDVE